MTSDAVSMRNRTSMSHLALDFVPDFDMRPSKSKGYTTASRQEGQRPATKAGRSHDFAPTPIKLLCKVY